MPEIVMTPASDVAVGDVFSTDGGIVTEITHNVIAAFGVEVVQIVVVAHGAEKVGVFDPTRLLPLWK